ncbi:MAG: hypothetical protein AB1673_16480, partial [Actinomycetota bacterium]
DTMTTRRIVGIDLGVTSSHTVVVIDETTAVLARRRCRPTLEGARDDRTSQRSPVRRRSRKSARKAPHQVLMAHASGHTRVRVDSRGDLPRTTTQADASATIKEFAATGR